LDLAGEYLGDLALIHPVTIARATRPVTVVLGSTPNRHSRRPHQNLEKQ
jgi:uncharacterized NAD-dependent epimerase/dehydratase family protein